MLEGRPEVDVEPVRRLKVADSVAAQLAQLITDGELPAGSRLPAERQLATRFGVGRSSMREALRTLESRGLIRTEHGVGVRVAETPMTAEAALLMLDGCTLPDLFEIRRSLEPLAAGLAARHATPAMIDDISALHHESLRADDQRFVRLDARLHRTVAQASGNPVLARICCSIESLHVTYSERVIGLPGRRAAAEAGHAQIVSAIAERRAGLASNAALRHIRDVEDDVAAQLHRDVPRAAADVRERW
ncbi:FadR/GntR family transcriptional regulator [uncultured Jatrophihabitans sp.]|uniref:FadR/GntR family transcriptional regulator n=1 Tax=uncultured Jatrophihabitans sp. TaxID=1610747 RepID=UPI0035CAF6B4